MIDDGSGASRVYDDAENKEEDGSESKEDALPLDGVSIVLDLRGLIPDVCAADDR